MSERKKDKDLQLGILSMRKAFNDDAWEEYLYWQTFDKKIFNKINSLIKDIERNGVLKGLGKPEALKGDLSGMYSRHIDDKNRLVYYIKENMLIIVSCKTHYKDK